MKLINVKRALLNVLLVGSSLIGNANAGLISGDYTLNNGKKVELQGLEWLSLDYTAGLSRIDIEDGFTDRYGNNWQKGEWQYASRVQTETLLGSLWGGVFNGHSADNAIGANWFLTHFAGLAYDAGYGVDRIDGQSTNHHRLNHDASRFFFGEDSDCAINADGYEGSDELPIDAEISCLGSVEYGDSYDNSVTAFNVISNKYERSYDKAVDNAYGSFKESAGVNMGVYVDNSNYFKNYQNSSYGSLLVRTSTVAVPEPSTLAIFALGAIGLMARRFKQS